MGLPVLRSIKTLYDVSNYYVVRSLLYFIHQCSNERVQGKMLWSAGEF